MELCFVGTGARDYVGNPPKRYFTSTFIDGVLVDASPVIWDALKRAKIAAEQIRHVVYTHSHVDHFSEDVTASFSEKLLQLRSVNASKHLMSRIRPRCPRPRWKAQVMAPGSKAKLGGLTWEAFRANHPSVNPPETPLNYRVSQGGLTVLVFNDTALPHLETVRALQKGPPAHVMLMDATMGLIDDDWRMFEHSSIQQVSRVAACWKEMGILRKDAVVLCNHMSRGLLAGRKPTRPMLERLGVRLSPEAGRLRLVNSGWVLTDAKGTQIAKGKFRG